MLSDRDDLIRVLTELDVDPRFTESSTLEVHGTEIQTIDLLATVDEEPDEDFEGTVALDLTRIDIPALPGRPLPPGHPVLVDGEPLHYGCTAFYN
ncbi:hypothetical protein [Dactylosporangium sp. NPDC051541]|uniref:hypothetical protein n=1 Tax=Dactylosporangium sp. NPDC051541 TaxID=3363977 RepID=UPI00379502EB